jgi:heterodisulfide reductase subunit A-like polyferredoxin/coenzyme F420-reducing hydrogenase delta subunit
MTPKTGIFLCTCDKTITKSINFKKVAKELRPLTEVVEVADLLCHRDISYITQYLRWKDERRLDRIIIGACPGSRKGRVFRDILRDKELVMVDIREGCGWVHSDKTGATAKTIALLKLALKKERHDEWSAKIDPRVLVFGGGEAAEISDILERLDVEAEFYSPTPTTRGLNYPYEIKGIEGTVGSFKVSLRRECFIDGATCVDCGRCLPACPEEAIGEVEGRFFIYRGRCTRCGECVKVCPTESINLDAETKEVETGAVVILGESGFNREGVFTCSDPEPGRRLEKGKDAVLRIMEYVAGRRLRDLPAHDPGACANRAVKGKEVPIRGCDYCLKACPYGIINLKEEPFIDEKGCRECGLCQGACPQGALTMSAYGAAGILSDIDTLTEAHRAPLLLVTCEAGGNILEMAGRRKIEYPVVMPLRTPCIGCLDETHILRAMEAGARGVLMLCFQDSCPHPQGFSLAERHAEVVRGVLNGFGVEGDRIKVLRLPPIPEEVTGTIHELVKSLPPTPGMDRLPPVDGSNPRQLFLNQLKRLRKLRGQPREVVLENDAMPYGRIAIDMEKCVNCGACAAHCTTEAMEIEKSYGFADVVTFNYPYCIACGICRDICPEKALELRRVFHLRDFADEWRETFSSELVPCSKCGKPFITKSMLDKIREATGGRVESITYCPSCRDEIAFKNMLE